MKVFRHHLYEYRKGLRNLVLHTLPGVHRPCVEAKLAAEGIDYVVQGLANGNINVFFGAPDCVAVIRAIGKNSLNDYTPEEDFILGTMLGYGRLQQCTRYIRMRKHRDDCDVGSEVSRSNKSAGRDDAPACIHRIGPIGVAVARSFGA